MKKLPSFVWILLLVGGLIALIGAIIGGFLAIATIPGVASVIMLAAGLAVVWGAGLIPTEKSSSFITALGISFFALMGMAIDQVGNPIYNYPFNWFCPEGTQIERSVDVSHPLPGRTDIVQDFRCLDQAGSTARRIGMFEMIGVRFVEYVLIGYLLKAVGSFLPRKRLSTH